MPLYTLLLFALYLVHLGQCDTSMTFIFPPNATKTYTDTRIANISIHFNDNITVEYQLPDTQGQVWLTQSCFASVKAMINEDGETFSNGNSFNNTGALHWNVGNGNNGNYTGIKVCRFEISNYTIANCAWGPWGILNWDQSQDLLLYSQLFNISAAKSGTKPKLVTNSQTSTSQKLVTATAAPVNCPPSGIPARAIYTPVPVVEQIPPMSDNITFPP
ncbi:hypothetical protein EG329_000804 [Mollisiaceae sp. DMI_Dod_QoI]|nr:hypothetical protein EG329_000804 [Helotiales sp. DMI_Dod_QoI]